MPAATAAATKNRSTALPPLPLSSSTSGAGGRADGRREGLRSPEGASLSSLTGSAAALRGGEGGDGRSGALLATLGSAALGSAALGSAAFAGAGSSALAAGFTLAGAGV